MKQQLGGLPKKTIKRILSNNCGGQISRESIEFIQSFLETQLQEICRNVVTEHQEINQLRRFHGIPEKRRFDVNLFKKVSTAQYKPQVDLLVEGEVGKHNGKTTLSDKANIEVV